MKATAPTGFTREAGKRFDTSPVLIARPNAPTASRTWNTGRVHTGRTTSRAGSRWLRRARIRSAWRQSGTQQAIAANPALRTAYNAAAVINAAIANRARSSRRGDSAKVTRVAAIIVSAQTYVNSGTPSR